MSINVCHRKNKENTQKDADRLEFQKDEPSVHSPWDDKDIATNHREILHSRRNARLSEFGRSSDLCVIAQKDETKSDTLLPKITGAEW